jgi:hypothetical protein
VNIVLLYSYCKIADTAGDVPSAFVSVTLTDNTDDALPFTLNGCVSVNWLPKGGELALLYHCVKSGVTGVLTWLVVNVAPADAENW